MSVRVAEGFISGDKTYQEVVKTLDKHVGQTYLFDFEQLDVNQHHRNIDKNVPMEEYLLDQEPSEEVIRKHAELRSKLLESMARPQLPPRPSQLKVNHDSTKTMPDISLKMFKLSHAGVAQSCLINIQGGKNPDGFLGAANEGSSDEGEYEDIEALQENSSSKHRKHDRSGVNKRNTHDTFATEKFSRNL